jgi:hypothetical protein
VHEDPTQAHQRIVLGDALRTTGSASLDLTDAESDGKVSDAVHGVSGARMTAALGNAQSVLGLARAMGNHDAPASGLGLVRGLDGLADRADLVDLEEETVASFELDGAVPRLQPRKSFGYARRG